MMRLRKQITHYTIIYLIISVYVIFSALPFYWMVITAFRSDREFYSADFNPFWYSSPPTTSHITYLFEHTQFLTFVKNSLEIGIVVVAITIVTAVPAAYSLARLARRWGERLAIGIFFVYLVPPTLLFIPLSRVVAFLGLQDSKWALVVVYPTFTIPFCVWLLSSFMKSIPRDIEEQALIDGYSRVGALLRVVMPLSIPGILTVVVFAFMLSLHEFIYALAFVSSSSQKPISVGVPTELILGDVFFWQSLMAAAVIVAIPVALVYNVFLDRFISGFTLGAVKG
jgi:multiple sugar transport system permease protein